MEDGHLETQGRNLGLRNREGERTKSPGQSERRGKAEGQQRPPRRLCQRGSRGSETCYSVGGGGGVGEGAPFHWRRPFPPSFPCSEKWVLLKFLGSKKERNSPAGVAFPGKRRPCPGAEQVCLALESTVAWLMGSLRNRLYPALALQGRRAQLTDFLPLRGHSPTPSHSLSLRPPAPSGACN